MASIDFINKRIEGKEKEIAKLNKKLERIRKVEAQNWEDPNPYYYNEYDLKRCLRELDDANKSLEGYKNQLAAEVEKANSRDVKIIIDFLDMWKERVRKFYSAGLVEYYKDKEELHSAYREIDKFLYGTKEYKDAYDKYKELSKCLRENTLGKFEDRERVNRFGKIEKYSVKIEDGEYEYLKVYIYERTLDEALAKLEKDLVQEANRKYDFIIERTNKIVGTITDASNLIIGAKDDLNGYIVGNKGTAKVQTIGAGGYNIQCYHFRTLINKA